MLVIFAETPWRARLGAFVDSPRIQNLMMAVIFINAATIGLETAWGHDTEVYLVLHILDVTALVIFTIEIVLKLLAYGPKRFFTDGWNIFDFAVVVIALVPGSGPLSVLRTLRVLRVLRLVKFFPQLRRVVEALLRAIPGIGAIGLLMTLLFYVAAVMATVMFREQQPEFFGDLGKSLFSLFQIMTLESWAMGIVRPTMAGSPAAWVFFIPFILISAFTMLNLFIAVIVDTMQNMRAESEDEDAQEVALAQSEAAEATSELHASAALTEVLSQLAALRTEVAQLKRESIIIPAHRHD